ncbi:hypothetical protein KF840_04945 [bacterium]|nr:hypothetical protein [bacterium]
MGDFAGKLVLTALAVAVSFTTAGAQPLDRDARKCVAAVDKGMSLQAKAQTKVALDCLKRGASGALPAIDACLGADAKGQLAKQRLKAIGNEGRFCATGDLPAFAVPGLVGPYAPPPDPAAFDPDLHEIYAETTLAAAPRAVDLALRDAFGDSLDVGILRASANPAGAKCQARLAKAITGCAGAQRKAFLSCKKKALAGGAASGGVLESACLMTAGNPATGIPDPSGAVGLKCASAFAASLSQHCAGQVAAALPGGCGGSADPAACLAARVACRVCQEANSGGDLNRDCDLFDDGQDNASCAATVPVCGNDVLDAPSEQCDDGNRVDGDCCSATCQLEATPCPAPRVVIDSPAHGSFTQAALVQVTGHVEHVNVNDALLTLNGAPLVLARDKTFSTGLAPDAARVFTPAFARLTRQRDGAVARDRIAVIAGAARAAAAGAASGIALRLNDSAFDALEPLLSSLVPPLDLSAVLTPGTPLISDLCYLPLGNSCLGTIDVAIGSTPAPGIDGVGFDIDSQTGKLVVAIDIQNLRLPLTITSVTGAPLSCDVQVQAPSILLTGNYALSPLAADPTQIDVAQIGNVGVTTPGLTSTTTCSGGLGGLAPVINALAGQLVAQLANTLLAPLNQVDGNGNTPTAALLESALGAIQLGPLLSTGLGLDVQAPWVAIDEDALGVSFAADLIASAPLPAPGAPVLPQFLAVAESFPAFGATTPAGAMPFDAGLGLSTTAVNAILRARTEQGLLQLATTALDLGGGASPLTAGLLAPALPGFAALPPATPLTLRVLPTLAPVLTGAGAPIGVLAELRLGHVLLEVVENPGPGETVHLRAAVDARFDVELAAGPAGLTFSLTAPTASDVTVAVLLDPLASGDASVTALMPTVLTNLLPDLAGALGTIPLPGVIGSNLEVSRSPYYTVFAELGSLL